MGQSEAAVRERKTRLLEALREQVAADLAALTQSQTAEQAGATHAEARSEHAKDTRATESAYLARGLAARVTQLQDAEVALGTLQIASFTEDDAIGMTALVELESEDTGERSWVFLVTAGGGLRLTEGDREVRALTPAAPLGSALVGRELGDEVAFETPEGSRRSLVVSLE